MRIEMNLEPINLLEEEGVNERVFEVDIKKENK
jgi:hypothetical protein